MNLAQILVTVDSVSWAPVTVPVDQYSGRTFNAKSIIFDNSEDGSQDTYRRIVDTDATTQKLIPAGSQALWKMSDDPRGMSGYSAAPTGMIVAYLKSVSGSFDVSVEFLG